MAPPKGCASAPTRKAYGECWYRIPVRGGWGWDTEGGCGDGSGGTPVSTWVCWCGDTMGREGLMDVDETRCV